MSDMLSNNLQDPLCCFLEIFQPVSVSLIALLCAWLLIEPIMRIFISSSFTIKTVKNVRTAQGVDFRDADCCQWRQTHFRSLWQFLITFSVGRGKELGTSSSGNTASLLHHTVSFSLCYNYTREER